MGPHHWSLQFADFACLVHWLLSHLNEKLFEDSDVEQIQKLMNQLGDMEFRRHRWDHSRMTLGMRILLALGRVGFSKDEIMARALTPQSLMYVIVLHSRFFSVTLHISKEKKILSKLEMLVLEHRYGYGPQVVRVLDMLTRRVCEKITVDTTPNYDNMENDIQVLEEDAVTSAQEMTFEDEDEMSVDSIVYDDGVDLSSTTARRHDIIRSSVDATQWKREVNEAIDTFRGTSLEGVPSAGSRLLNLTNSILSQRLDDICRDVSLWRDQVLSPDLKALTILETRINSARSVDLIKVASSESRILKTKVLELQKNISDRSEQLSQIVEVSEDLCERIEDRQREINEVSVLSEARRSIRTLRDEIVDMNVRIGYLRGELMRRRVIVDFVGGGGSSTANEQNDGDDDGDDSDKS